MEEIVKRRGPYKKTKEKQVISRPTNYFRPEHENQGYFISWSNAYDRGNGQISVCYKLQGDRKQYRCPRWKTVWFDKLGIEKCKLAVEDWKKSNNNSTGIGNLLPVFYQRHRKAFYQWLNNTAKHSTIYHYEQALRQYVFPYFVERLGLTKATQWNQDIVDKWESFICENIKEASSRNRKRTALRRYLKFLKRTGEIKVIPQLFDEAVKRKTKETIIPGELPKWNNVVSWLRSLPAGRYRFIRAICMGFGVRISEAMMVEEEDFFGMESVEHISSRNDFISRIVDKKLGALFLYVNKARKKKVSREIIRTLGEQDRDPKTGPYTACCTSFELAQFIIEMINNGEHLEKIKSDDVYKIIYSMPIDDSVFKFNEYRPHDDRRLNITLQCLDLSMDINDVVEICTLLHGQSSREVFGRYFQWGLTQRRKQDKAEGKKLRLFTTKKLPIVVQ